MKSFFGEDIPDVPRSHRKTDHAHFAPVGSGPAGKTCGECRHIVKVTGASRVYRKCRLMRAAWTGGPGTDIRCKDPACRAFGGK